MNESTGLLTRTRYTTKALSPVHPAETPVFGRTKSVPGYSHAALCSSSAILVGAGGLNGEIGHALIRKGIGKLTIFDHDYVELSNLNRQRFFKEDLYQNKALALAKNLAKEATQHSEIIAYPLRFQDAADRGADISCTFASCGVDNDATRAYVSRCFRALQIPVVSVAVSRDASSGCVFVQEANTDGPCFGCLVPSAVDNDATNPCAAGATIDVLKVVAGIATYALDSLIMPRRRNWNYKEVFLSGALKDGHRMIEKRDDCPLCEIRPEIGQAFPAEGMTV